MTVALALVAVLALLLLLGPAAVIYRALTTDPDAQPSRHPTGPPYGPTPDPTRTRHAPEGAHLWLD